MSSQFAEFTQPGQKPVVNSIFDFSAEALGELRLWLEQNPPAVPITSVLGFSQFTAQLNTVFTLETYTGTAYGALPSAGPVLTGMPDGNYVIMHGALIEGNAAAGNPGYQSIRVNAVPASDADSCSNGTVDFVSVSIATLKVLSNGGNNTVTCEYRSNGAAISARFDQRWLLALRYKNV